MRVPTPPRDGRPADVVAGRYRIRGELGAGGMAIVLRALDERLGVEVALKVLRPDLDGPWALRFQREARLHASLRHPGICPVHDLGKLDDGRPFYTMGIVRGRPLPSVVYALRPMVRVLARVAETLAYVHREGIVHGDVSPENVVVEDSGEVTVIDWGLARRAGDPPDAVGTSGYWIDDPTPAADVHAFGALIRAAVRGEDADLSRLARRCRERAFPDARPIADALAGWLDGDARRSQARTLLEEAGRARKARRVVLTEVSGLRARAARLLDDVPGWAPETEKAAAWGVAAEADRREADAVIRAAAAETAIRAALEAAPDLTEAHGALVDHWLDELDAAEARGDGRDALRVETLLRRHAGGRYIDYLEAHVKLRIDSVPSGAPVSLEREARPLGRSVWEPTGGPGVTPWEQRLPAGRWRVTVAGVRVPVRLVRGRPARVTVRLPLALGPDDVYIAGGPFHRGGDALAPDALPEAEVDVPGFVLRRHPVTWRDYLLFVADSPQHAPRESAGLHVTPRVLCGPGPDGRLVPLPDASGRTAALDEPVVLVDWFGAMAFAAWESARTGVAWRLPHDHEWEKAARGVDRRAFPWGDFFDPSWCNMAQSRPGAPHVATVEEFPVDESPYGVRGLGGNVREWCLNDYSRGGPPAGPLRVEAGSGPLRMIRGGSWSSTAWLCRSAARLASDPGVRLTSTGFRLARDA